MHRIDNATAAATPPTPDAPGTPGHWTKGNPGTGTPATVMDQDWFQAVQEEFMTLLAVGGVPAVKGTHTQAAQALKRAFGGYTRTLTAGATLTADDAGLVRVNAASGPQTITLPAAASAGGAPIRFSFARTDTTGNVVTIQRAGSDAVEGGTTFNLPTGARSTLVSDGSQTWLVQADGASSSVIATNGYMALARGIILQWGEATLPASGAAVSSVAVGFPLTFPNGVLAALALPRAQANSGAGRWPALGVSGVLTTQMTINGETFATTTFNQTVPIYWVAVGR